MKELHLFIIWNKALPMEELLTKEVEDKFAIKAKIYLHWSDALFSENLSRFYGTKLPDRSAKEQHIGKGEFLLLIVEDENAVYDQRMTSKGNRIVNINMFDMKEHLRHLCGGGHTIHGTDSEIETNHNLTLLLGMNVQDFYQNNHFHEYEEVKRDLLGAKVWNTVDEIFYALNNCTNYLILRNYEILPEDIYMNDHNDIDILCENTLECKYVLNAEKVYDEPFRFHFVTFLKERKVYFDLRELGDNYYCQGLEEALLQTKVFNNHFFIPETSLYFYTLLYHALIHKPIFSDEYANRLKEMKSEYANYDQESFTKLLNHWLLTNDYNIIRPIDFSVYFNENVLCHFDRSIYHKNSTLSIRGEYYDNEIQALQSKIILLQNENEYLNSRLNTVINSKGWKILEKIRNLGNR